MDAGKTAKPLLAGNKGLEGRSPTNAKLERWKEDTRIGKRKEIALEELKSDAMAQELTNSTPIIWKKIPPAHLPLMQLV